MSRKTKGSLNGGKAFQINVAKNREIWLNFDRFIPESLAQDIHLLSDVPEILVMHQTKTESARLVFLEKPF